jgi:hypothetical protein
VPDVASKQAALCRDTSHPACGEATPEEGLAALGQRVQPPKSFRAFSRGRGSPCVALGRQGCSQIAPSYVFDSCQDRISTPCRKSLSDFRNSSGIHRKLSLLARVFFSRSHHRLQHAPSGLRWEADPYPGSFEVTVCLYSLSLQNLALEKGKAYLFALCLEPLKHFPSRRGAACVLLGVVSAALMRSSVPHYLHHVFPMLLYSPPLRDVAF